MYLYVLNLFILYYIIYLFYTIYFDFLKWSDFSLVGHLTGKNQLNTNNEKWYHSLVYFIMEFISFV